MAKTPDIRSTGKSDLFRESGGWTEKPHAHDTLVYVYEEKNPLF